MYIYVYIWDDLLFNVAVERVADGYSPFEVIWSVWRSPSCRGWCTLWNKL